MLIAFSRIASTSTFFLTSTAIYGERIRLITYKESRFKKARYSLLILGFLVFVHELGHFLTAKKFGIKVTEFGFGPWPTTRLYTKATADGDNRSFGGAQVSRPFYARGQTGQQLLLGAYRALSRQKTDPADRAPVRRSALGNGRRAGAARPGVY